MTRQHALRLYAHHVLGASERSGTARVYADLLAVTLKGAIVNRRNESTPLTFEAEWSGPGQDATAFNNDHRWAVLSTSISALIVGSIAWLAVSTMPPVTGGTVENASRGFLPYRLFQQLTESGSNVLFGSVAPVPGTRQQPTGFDHALNAERAAQRSSIETHTVTLDTGDTLTAALENAGISADDANAAIAALGKVHNARSLRAGQSFDITYNTRPDIAANGSNPSADDDDSDMTPYTAEPSVSEISPPLSMHIPALPQPALRSMAPSTRTATPPPRGSSGARPPTMANSLRRPPWGAESAPCRSRLRLPA